MFFIKKKNSIRAINSNISTTKTEIINKFEIVSFTSYLEGTKYLANYSNDLTIKIPGISKYQYICIEGDVMPPYMINVSVNLPSHCR